MARPTKKINPLDLKKNVAIWIPFPLGGTPIFSSTFTTEEQALSNLKNLLLTRKGERPFQPLFGTDVSAKESKLDQIISVFKKITILESSLI